MNPNDAFGMQLRHDIVQLARARELGNEALAQRIVVRILTAIRDEMIAQHGEEAWQREAPGVLKWLVDGAVAASREGVELPTSIARPHEN